MGRANNERPSCSSKAQQIFRSVIGIHHKSFKILILLSKSFLSQVCVLDMVGSMLGYLNSHQSTTVTAHSLYTHRGESMLASKKVIVADSFKGLSILFRLPQHLVVMRTLPRHVVEIQNYLNKMNKPFR